MLDGDPGGERTGRVFDHRGISLGVDGQVGADRPGNSDARGNGCRHQHPDRGVYACGNESARRDRAARAERRQQDHLRHGLRRDIPKSHQRSRFPTDVFYLGDQLRPSLELFRAFRARHAELPGAQQHHRHSVVDQRDAMPGDFVRPLPVGNSGEFPPTSNSIAHAMPGTPSIAKSPP